MSDHTTPPTDDAIAAAINTLKQAGFSVSQITGTHPQVKTPRPSSYSDSSVATYYKETEGKAMQLVLDKMMEHQLEGFFLPKEKMRMSVTSTYMRFQQGIRYLLDNLDPDGKYRAFRDRIRLIKADEGLYIKYKKGYNATGAVPKNHEINWMAEIQKNSWRVELDKFLLEAEPGAKFFRDKLALAPEDINELQNLLEPFTDVLSVVTQTYIRVAKLKPDDANVLNDPFAVNEAAMYVPPPVVPVFGDDTSSK